MPRKKDSTFESLPATVVYREDIEEAIETIQRVCEKVVLTSEKSEYESIKELQEHIGDKLPDLEIEGKSSSDYRRLSIHFQSSSVYLSRSSNEEINAAWYHLQDLVLRKNRPSKLFHSVFYSKETQWAYTQIATMMLLIILANLRTTVPAWLWITASIIFVFFTISMFFSPSSTVVYLKRKHEVTTFWIRNRDEIIKLIIAAIIGASLTLMIQLLINKLSAQP